MRAARICTTVNQSTSQSTRKHKKEKPLNNEKLCWCLLHRANEREIKWVRFSVVFFSFFRFLRFRTKYMCIWVKFALIKFVWRNEVTERSGWLVGWSVVRSVSDARGRDRRKTHYSRRPSFVLCVAANCSLVACWQCERSCTAYERMTERTNTTSHKNCKMRTPSLRRN